MPVYKTKLIEKLQEAEKTWSYRFSKPADFDYIAGQHSVLKLDIPDAEPQDRVRTFSFSSAPSEEFLQITMREGISFFKKYLQSMKNGEEVTLFEPAGSFTLPDKPAQSIAMIAGGVGIAPFRSILKDARDKSLAYNFTLLYANPTRERIAFYKELETLRSAFAKAPADAKAEADKPADKQKNDLKIIYTLTGKESNDWNGETKRIDAEFIKKYVKDLANFIFYICGSPDMAADIEEILCQSLDIKKDNIKAERFSGY